MVPVPDSPRLGAQDKRGARVCPRPCPWETRGNRKHDALWLALRTRAVALAIKTRLHVTPDPQPKVMEQVPVTLGEGLSLTPWSALTPRRDQTRTSRPADAQLGARAGAESPCSPTRRPARATSWPPGPSVPTPVPLHAVALQQLLGQPTVSLATTPCVLREAPSARRQRVHSTPPSGPEPREVRPL